MSWIPVKTAASGIVMSVKRTREQRGSAVGAPQAFNGRVLASSVSSTASPGLKQTLTPGVVSLKVQGV